MEAAIQLLFQILNGVTYYLLSKGQGCTEGLQEFLVIVSVSVWRSTGGINTVLPQEIPLFGVVMMVVEALTRESKDSHRCLI